MRGRYLVHIDWDGDGDFDAADDVGENVSRRLLARTALTIRYGRDQAQATAPVAPGAAAWELDNRSKDYSPDNSASPIAGDLGPARKVRIEYARRQNLVANPSFESPTLADMWTPSGGSLTSSTSVPQEGSRSGRFAITSVASSPHLDSDAFPVLAGQAYTVSGYDRPGQTGTRHVGLKIVFYDADDTVKLNPTDVFTACIGGSYTRIHRTLTAPAGATKGKAVWVWSTTDAVVGDVHNVDAVIVEDGDELGDYIDGDSTGGKWRGDDHASSSIVGYTLYRGHLDDYQVIPDQLAPSASMTALDPLADLSGVDLSTPVYEAIRTGAAVGKILDAVGWPADKRDLDLGGTVIPYWWEEGTDAFEALQKIVSSEGPGALVTISADGDFVFQDRHHRLTSSSSTGAQTVFRDSTHQADGVTFIGSGGDTFSGNTSFDLTLPAAARAGDMMLVAAATVDDDDVLTMPGTTIAQDSTGTMNYAFASLELDEDDISAGTVTLATSGTTNVGAAFAVWRHATGFGTAGSVGLRTGGQDTTPAPAASTAVDGQLVAVMAVEKSNSPHGVDSVTPATTQLKFADPGSNTWPSAYIGVYTVDGSAAARTINYANSSTNPNGAAIQVPILAGTEPRYSPPLTYDVGWKFIINSVQLSIDQRVKAEEQVIWSTDETITLAAGESTQIVVQADDPFVEAVTPVEDVDYTLSTGTPKIGLTRKSGQSTTIRISAFGGTATVIRGLQLRAHPVVSVGTTQVLAEDTASQDTFGLRSLQTEAPWCNANDAAAIADLTLLRYSQRRPIVSLALKCGQGGDPDRFAEALSRDLSDRVHVVDTATGLDDDFYVEQISHTVEGAGMFHTTEFGLEKADSYPDTPFQFDVSGHGFDDGVFVSTGLDDPVKVFIFDDQTQGKFGTGRFAH